jgi:hypothetical protein
MGPEVRVADLKVKDPPSCLLHILGLGQELEHRLADQTVRDPGESPHGTPMAQIHVSRSLVLPDIALS